MASSQWGKGRRGLRRNTGSPLRLPFVLFALALVTLSAIVFTYPWSASVETPRGPRSVSLLETRPRSERPSGARLPCNRGPYVWDQATHREGLGSTLQWRKPSLVTAHYLNASWIGSFFNAHDKKKRNAAVDFGEHRPQHSFFQF